MFLFYQYLYGEKREEIGMGCIGHSTELSNKELIEIESFSQYARIPKRGDNQPEKFIFKKLESGKFIFGKGMYIGRDKVGRKGSYLFHNLIINEKDFREIKLNPIDVIEEIERKGLFLTTAPDESYNFEPLNIDFDSKDRVADSELVQIPFALKNKESLKNLFYACFLGKTRILIKGKIEDYKNFIRWLFNYLPAYLLEEMSFNTCCSGQYDPLTKIICMIEEGRDPFISSSIRINLNDSTIFNDIKEEKRYQEFIEEISNKIIEGKSSEAVTFRQISERIKERKLEEIKLLSERLGLPTLNIFKDFIEEIDQKEIVDLSLAENEAILIYPILLEIGHDHLKKILRNEAVLMELFNFLKKEYSPEKESILINELIKATYFREIKDSLELADLLQSFPVSPEIPDNLILKRHIFMAYLGKLKNIIIDIKENKELSGLLNSLEKQWKGAFSNLFFARLINYFDLPEVKMISQSYQDFFQNLYENRQSFFKSILEYMKEGEVPIERRKLVLKLFTKAETVTKKSLLDKIRDIF